MRISFLKRLIERIRIDDTASGRIWAIHPLRTPRVLGVPAGMVADCRAVHLVQFDDGFDDHRRGGRKQGVEHNLLDPTQVEDSPCVVASR